MKTGELTDSVKNRTVFRQLYKGLVSNTGNTRSHMPERAAPEGQSGALPEQVISTVGPLPGYAKMPWRQVTAAANSLVADGAEPQTLLLQGLLSKDTEESALRETMRRFAAEAEIFGLSFSDANIQVSGCVSMPQYFVTGTGTRCGPARRILSPGQELVVVRQIGLAGTAALVWTHETGLLEHFPTWLVERAKGFDRWMPITEAVGAVNHFGGCSMRRIAQGGIFNALWEMADLSGVGLEVDLRKIPVYQETIEICEYFDVNPYYLYSEGALLVGTDRAEALTAALADAGIFAAAIGMVTDGNDRVIYNGENRRYLDRPQQDELWKVSEKKNR
ncbi:MAG: hypothetical protein LUI14_09405 [Lachnospiraceae bacterium]|nr:hypothetical protein [Lachnospiraceae bacterium]